MKIPIPALLALRGQVSDQALIDYITLAHLAPDAGIVQSRDLQERWGCTQPQVSRRLSAIRAAGLADISAGHGAYSVHQVARLGSS